MKNDFGSELMISGRPQGVYQVGAFMSNGIIRIYCRQEDDVPNKEGLLGVVRYVNGDNKDRIMLPSGLHEHPNYPGMQIDVRRAGHGNHQSETV